MNLANGMSLMAAAVVVLTTGAPRLAAEENAAESEPVRHSFSVDGIQVPKGSAVLIGLDRADLGCLIPPEPPAAGAADRGAGLEAISGAVAVRDLTLAVTITPPEKTEHMAMWRFRIRYAWAEERTEESAGVDAASVKITTTAIQTASGSFSLGYNVLVAMRSDYDEARRPDGTLQPGPAWYSRETRFPMKLEAVPLEAKGVSIARIAYTAVGGKTQSLVILTGESIDLLSQRVRVGRENPKFAWSPAWFKPLGRTRLEDPEKADSAGGPEAERQPRREP